MAGTGGGGSDPAGEAPDGVVLERVQEGLEKVFVGAPPFHDTGWLQRGAEISGLVCVVRRGTEALGSAFLVGPDLVLTACHVVKDAAGLVPGHTAATQFPASELRFVFDHALRNDGQPQQTVEVGVVLEGWSRVFSPINKLDFALIRIERDLGRGFVSLARDVLPLDRPGLAIVQHPNGAPRKIAFKGDEIAQLSADGQRLEHTVPSEGGSSGSPLLSLSDWSLIGLHVSAKDNRNLGVPIWLIAKQPNVEAEISASLARRPNVPASAAPAVSLSHAAVLLRDSRVGERAKGRKLLREIREASPATAIPADVIAVLVESCEHADTPDEQRASFDTARLLRAAKQVSDVGLRCWLDPRTDDSVLQSLASLFSDDTDGLVAVYELLEKVPFPLSGEMIRRVKLALTTLQGHVQVGTPGQDRERTLAIVERFHRTPPLWKVAASLYTAITGALPDWYGRKTRVRKIVESALLLVFVAGVGTAAYLWHERSKHDEACALAPAMFDPFADAFATRREDWCAGRTGTCTARDDMDRTVTGDCRGGFAMGDWAGKDEAGRTLWTAQLNNDHAIWSAYRYMGEARAVLTKDRFHDKTTWSCGDSSFTVDKALAIVKVGSESAYSGEWSNDAPTGTWTAIRQNTVRQQVFKANTRESAAFAVQLTLARDAIKMCSPVTLPEFPAAGAHDSSGTPSDPGGSTTPPPTPLPDPSRCVLDGKKFKRTAKACTSSCISQGPGSPTLKDPRAKALNCNDVCDCDHTGTCWKNPNGGPPTDEGNKECPALDLNSEEARGLIKLGLANGYTCQEVRKCP